MSYEDFNNYLNNIRRDFAGKPLDESSVKQNPFDQLYDWFDDAVGAQVLDPNAMLLSTVDKNLQPKSRVVLLRGIENGKLFFYTNYESDKGKEIEFCHKVALSFFWLELNRQIRIEGTAQKCASEKSDAYFASRPRDSQIGAWASAQSQSLSSRAELEEKFKYYQQKFEGKPVPRPPNWGGYEVSPEKFEFWQGRPNRLHDRILYLKSDNRWIIKRLYP